MMVGQDQNATANINILATLVMIMEIRHAKQVGMDLNVMFTALQQEEDINIMTVLPMELKCVMSITMARIVLYIACPRMTSLQATHVRRMAVRSA